LSDTSTSVVMPGGGIARRPLHCFILADCSGSMKGEKMQALNFAIADMLPHLAAWERDQEQAAVFVRVIAFATEPTWHVAEPTAPSSLRWSPLSSVERGLTNMAPVFEMVAEALAPGQLERRALRPAVLLVTDGLPTDPPERFDSALETLVSGRAGRAALRLAVAIGRDAKSEALTRFIGDPAVPVLVADNTDEIAERLVVASLAVSRMSEVGADREAIASQLLHPQVPVTAPPDLDTIV
jgi:uncharacterized protein YegL